MTTVSMSRAAHRARYSTWLELLTRTGLIGYGVLHLAIAWLAVAIATGHQSGHADQSGAFRLLDRQPFGHVLLIVIAIGLGAMALWQLLLAAIGHREFRGRRRAFERLASAGRVLLYGFLLWTDVQILQNRSTSSAASQQRATAGVLAHPAGPTLVAIIGVAVVAVAVGMVVYGLRKVFLSKLRFGNADPRVRRGVAWLGQLGYIGRGVAIGVMGVLLFQAGRSDNAARSRGLDGALRALADRRLGGILLGLIAIGFAAFGIYCLFQAKYRKV